MPVRRILALGSLLPIFLIPDPAVCLELSLISETSVKPGVVVRQYRTANPACDVWAAEIDLCQARVHVEATEAPSSLTSPPAWGAAQGVSLAVNGDFYKTGPVRVYGEAVGSGVAWPLEQTGLDSSYSSEWYYQDYGWIAFGHDRVDYTHTKWVKQNAAQFGELGGWAPGTVAPSPPPGTLSLVSGFPELVVEGQKIVCNSPTDTSCFPDRSDMRDRHPRSAMGLKAGLSSFLLVVVDGRTTQSAGMYGAELADLMDQLGAWVAFNIDGGGSSCMWTSTAGTLNNPSDGSPRAVANHWGVVAGTGTGRPERAGHCMSQPVCGSIPPEGGVIDDDSPCFRTFGPQEYWREESAGYGGHLYWTNAWTTDLPSNWAWWRLEMEEAGSYSLEVYLEPDFSLFDRTSYLLVVDGTPLQVQLDQGAASGWTSLGDFQFAAGGDQFLAVYDDCPGSVASGQHIAADAIRLTRLDMPEDGGSGDEDAGQLEDGGLFDGGGDVADEDGPGDADDASDGGAVDDGGSGLQPAGEGCGCGHANPTAEFWILFLLFPLFMRATRQ